MKYIEMSLEEAKKVAKKDAIVLVAIQDLANEDCNIGFSKKKFCECNNILEEAKSIANEGLLSMSIVVSGVSIWESSDYELEDASLSLQKRSYMEEVVEVEKDVIVSSLSFSCTSPIVEEEE